MLSLRIKNETRCIGKSQGYQGLSIFDTVVDCTVTGPGTPAMRTAWEPTPAEMKAILRGAPIIVELIGTAHPPIRLFVGDVPDER